MMGAPKNNESWKPAENLARGFWGPKNCQGERKIRKEREEGRNKIPDQKRISNTGGGISDKDLNDISVRKGPSVNRKPPE